MKKIISQIRKCGGKTQGFLLAALFAFAAAQSARAEVVDLGGGSRSISSVADFSAYAGKEITNGTVNVTCELRDIASGTYTIGAGATVNASEKWLLNASAALVRIVDGGTLNFTGSVDCRFGYRIGQNDLYMDGGTFITTGLAGFPYPKPISSDNGKDLASVCTILNSSFSSADLRFASVENDKNKNYKENIVKADVGITNSTISCNSIFFGTSSEWVTDLDSSYVNASFGPGTDVTCDRFYVYKYPQATVVFDGLTAHLKTTKPSTYFFGKNASVDNFEGYRLLSGGLTFDVPVDFTHGEGFAPLVGEGGFTKTGAGKFTHNFDAFRFTGPVTVSNGTFSSTANMAASQFNVDGASSALELSGALTNATVSLSATAGGTLTLVGATIPNDTAPDLTLSGGGTTDYFTRDGAVGTYALDTLTLGPGAILDLDADATGIDAINAAVTNIAATVENKATININFASAPAGGTTFELFEADSADKFNVVPKMGNLTLLHETSVEEGRLVLTITAEDYVWNETGLNWGDAGAWTKGESAANWADGNNAIFSTAGAAASLAAPATVSEVRFTANATVSGAGVLSASEIIVAEGATATVSAPLGSAVKKTGPGTLTLTQSPANTVTLLEGTLAMSGASIAPANLVLGSGVTFDCGGGTFVGFPVATSATDATLANGTFGTAGGTFNIEQGTLRFAGNAVLVTNKTVTLGPNAGAGASALYKESGDWTVTGDFFLSRAAGTAPTFVQNGGTLTVGGYFSIGDWPGALPARLEINGGMVNSTHSGAYATIGASCDAFGIVRNGGVFNVSGNLLVGNRAIGTLTIDDGGTVNTSDIIFHYSDNGGASLVNLKAGGVLSLNRIYYRTNGNNEDCTFKFDGGTVKCKYQELITAHDHLFVKVASNGGVIDLQGKTVAINEPLLEDAESTGGGMTFNGGGVVTLASGNTYTGTTTVEVGTTVHVAAPGEIGAGLAVTLPATALEDGVYPIVVIDGEGTFEGLALPADPAENARLRLSGDKKSVFCIYGAPENVWVGGASGDLGIPANWVLESVPGNGERCIIGNATAASLTNSADSTFAPSYIIFPADSAAVTISGDKAISGVAEIESLSSATHTFNVPVNFAGHIAVKQNARGYATHDEAHVVFAGGANAAAGCTIASWDDGYSYAAYGRYSFANDASSRFSVTVYKRTSDNDIRFCVEGNSSLYVPYAGIMTELYVRQGGKVYVGDMRLDSGRMAWRSRGEIVVTNLLVTGTGDRYCTFTQGTSSDPAVFKFERVELDMTENYFNLADGNKASSLAFYIGAGGLNYSSSSAGGMYNIGGNYDGDNVTVRPWHSDFTIGDRGDGKQALGLTKNVTFCTDDESGTGRKITIDAITRGRYMPVVTVSGSGTLKVNKAPINSDQPTVIVTNTATLAFAPGASLGTGSMTICSGATLEVAESGKVGITNLVLNANATLAFHFTEKSAPILNLKDTTVNAAAGGKVSIKISAEDGIRPAYNRNGIELTSGGGFTADKISFSFDDSAAKWADRVEVNESGNVVLFTMPAGVMVLFK